MTLLANLVLAVVALLHTWFMILEVWLWTKPLGLKTFRQTKEQAQATAVLAKNQGVYNVFLAAGIVWAMCESDSTFAFRAKIFFASCVVIAGIVGAVTTGKKNILFIQAAPATLAIVLLALSP